jgi:hypothetical protein
MLRSFQRIRTISVAIIDPLPPWATLTVSFCKSCPGFEQAALSLAAAASKLCVQAHLRPRGRAGAFEVVLHRSSGSPLEEVLWSKLATSEPREAAGFPALEALLIKELRQRAPQLP